MYGKKCNIIFALNYKIITVTKSVFNDIYIEIE